ncbi:MAG: hypothetical protein ACRD3G_12595 [Vicinamibacterales bacterium]
MISAILLDVDGTLVDSNDAHAHAWVSAFADGPWDLLARLDGSPI